MGWFGKSEEKISVPAAQAETPKRQYRFEDFVDADWRKELPEETPRIDVAIRDIQALREQVANLKSDIKALQAQAEHVDDFFRKRIGELCAATAKEFASKVNCEVTVAALQKPEIQQLIQQTVDALFEREAQGLYEAVCKSVVKRLRG